jgi:hypothetical protein
MQRKTDNTTEQGIFATFYTLSYESELFINAKVSLQA